MLTLLHTVSRIGMYGLLYIQPIHFKLFTVYDTLMWISEVEWEAMFSPVHHYKYVELMRADCDELSHMELDLGPPWAVWCND